MISLAVAVVLAATPIRLEDVRVASRQATSAQLAELDRLRAGEQVTQSRAGLFPQVSVSTSAGVALQGRQRFLQPVEDPANPGSFIEQTIDIPGSQRPSLNLSVQLQQMIYDPALLANLRAAGARFDATSFQAAEERLSAELEGIRRFYLLLRAQKTLEVTAARAKNSQELVERAEALFQAGRRHKEDAISARINLGNDRTTLARRQVDIAQTSAFLAAYIQRPVGEGLEAVDPATVFAATPLPTFDEALERARQNRPILRAMEALIRAARETIGLAQAAYLPSLGASLTYGRNSPFPSVFFDPGFNNSFTGGVGLRWDVFNGFNTNSRVREAGYTERKAILQLEQSQRDLEADLRIRIEELRVAVDVNQIAKENLKLAEDNLALFGARFEQGAGTTLEIRDAQLKLTNASVDVIDTGIELELARAALERAIGAFGPGAAQ